MTTNYSICIPTIYKSISRSDICEYMNEYIGSVSRVDFVDLNQHNRRVFVHFSEWRSYAQILQYQLEKKGYSEIFIPNKKNKTNPIFHATLLINKNPLSITDYKFKKINKVLGEWAAVNREQQRKIDVLESKVLLLDHAFNKLYDSYYGRDMEHVMAHMDINELAC